MIRNESGDYLAEVIVFAKTAGLYPQLEKQLLYLSTYGDPDGDETYSRCDLYKDFAPHSFAFVMYRRSEDGEYKRWFNGGLIYQGPDCPAGGGPPSFTVSLTSGTGWFVHT